MKRSFVQAAFVVAALTLGACGSDAIDTSNGVDPAEAGSVDLLTRYWIKPDLVDCVGEMEQKCMQVAETEDGEYLWFNDQIDGFTFVEGTSYVIDVRIDDLGGAPADGSSLAYTLVKIVEET